MNKPIDPGKTYDYTSDECNRRSGVEKRVGKPDRRIKSIGLFGNHYSKTVTRKATIPRRTTAQRKEDK